MRIVIAPDSFKGSLTSLQAAKALEKAILQVDADSDILLKPMADGGEGTLNCIMSSSDVSRIPITCTGPLGTQIRTHYGIQGHTAIIEGALIAGLIQVPAEQRNPDNTTSYGIGEVIVDALDRGCTSIIVGIGGSATNDGGLGMLQALGIKMFTKDNQAAGKFGRDLFDISTIHTAGLDHRLKDVSIQVACDVDNPLCGEYGASAVYGPQKGASPAQIGSYDDALLAYSRKMESALGISCRDVQGAGAAGGLGFAFLLLDSEIVSGARLVAEAIHLTDAIQTADLVITGEGSSDEQTLYGKAPGYVAAVANDYHKNVILLSGSITCRRDLLSKNFSACFSIINEPLTIEACIQNAETLLMEQMKQVMRLITQI